MDDIGGGGASRIQRTILYIEDSDWNAVMVERILRPVDDLRVLSAGTVREALEIADREACDLVLTDLNLPDLAGEEILAALRGHPATGHLPVVVVSGENTPRIRARVRTAGAAAYLSKPYTPADLIATLRRALEGDPSEVIAPGGPGPEPAVELIVDRIRRMGDDGDRLLDRFVASAATDLAGVRAALEVGDQDQVHALAHRLKGSMSIFGAETAADRLGELSDLALVTLDGAEGLLGAADEAFQRYLDELGRGSPPAD